MKNQLVNNLKRHSPTGDLAYFIKFLHDHLIRMIATYVDNVIATENDYITKRNRMTLNSFKGNMKKFDSVIFPNLI